jgi:hypothetical protein
MNKVLFTALFEVCANGQTLTAAINAAKEFFGEPWYVYEHGGFGKTGHEGVDTNSGKKGFSLCVDETDDNIAALFMLVYRSGRTKDGRVVIMNTEMMKHFKLSVYDGGRNLLVIKIDDKGLYFEHIRKSYHHERSKKSAKTRVRAKISQLSREELLEQAT